jgi:hypothetical protein
MYLWKALKTIPSPKIGFGLYSCCNVLNHILRPAYSTQSTKGPSWPWSYGRWIHNYLCSQWLSPLMLWVRIWIRARCTTLCDKVCQWLATGRWFSPGHPVSSTNISDRHDIAEIVTLSTIILIHIHNEQCICAIYVFSNNTLSTILQ